MSLVHEALEKAKREASAKTARELGLPDAALGSGQPFRARRSLHPAAIGGAAALFVLALGGAVLWLVRAPSPPPSVEAPRAGTTAPSSTTPAPPLPPAAAAPEAPAPDIRRPEPASAVSPLPAATAVRPASSPQRRANASAPAATGVPPAPAAAPASKAPADAAFVPSFRREVTLDDGSVIKLGGIAWSEEAPLAYLNGKLYVRGERVAGMRVERIEKERVLLVGATGAKLYLALHQP